MWIKICGIHDVATAKALAALTPSAIGLNFYDGSPRVVPVDVAAEIVSRLPHGVEPVGLFVNQSADRIQKIRQRCRLRTLQLHGDERPELLADLQGGGEVKLIRAFRVGTEGLGPLADYLEKCRKLGVTLDGCLVDARVEGLYGGSGRTVCWELLADEYRRAEWPPLILAGGLEPGNVAEAIHTVAPWGVDVASGVESSPGQKDVERVARFIGAARQAFAAVVATNG